MIIPIVNTEYENATQLERCIEPYISGNSEATTLQIFSENID